MNPNDADAPLIERIKQGDVRAFEMLVVKYQRRIERLIGRMVRDSDLVQDIAQETFIRAYRALGQFRGESAFYTWLYRIALNVAKRHLGQRRLCVAHAPADDEGTFGTEPAPSDDATPESLLASRQLARDCLGALLEWLGESR